MNTTSLSPELFHPRQAGIVVLLVYALSASPSEAQKPSTHASPSSFAVPLSPPRPTTASLREGAAAVIDFYVQTYGETDLSPLVSYLQGTVDGSPNDVVPFLSLGHGYLNRYERNGDPGDFGRAVNLFEIPVREDIWPAWGVRWATSITLSHLMKGLLRLQRLAPDGTVIATRIAVLQDRVGQLAADEADRKLTDDTPYAPYDSCCDGDTKAEENAWEAVFLAWASGLFPDHPHAAAWEEKGRLLASLSIVTDSDRAFFEGQQIVTVHDDFTLENHGLSPNPYYAAATLMLLRMGALAYRMTGRTPPAEFSRNVENLRRKYRSYCVSSDGRWGWNAPADPQGDPALWPLSGLDDDLYVRSLVDQKRNDGALWLPTPPLASLAPDPEKGLTADSILGRAIQNGKVAWYYLDGAYLWLDPVPIPASR